MTCRRPISNKKYLYLNMPSRKRNKGKVRKAKKAELEAEQIDEVRRPVHNTWQGWARGLDKDGRVITQCNHGCDLVIPDNDHPVSTFIDDFFVNGIVKRMHIIDRLKVTFNSHRKVWNNKSYRCMAINIFVAIGTNLLLQNNITVNAKDVAIVIVMIENYDERVYYDYPDSLLRNHSVASKVRDLCSIEGGTNKRDALKLFRKRTACSCLKGMHLEMRKTQPKFGGCFHCYEIKERALLMVCSRCRIGQYCSRKCQIAARPTHKFGCDKYFKSHEQHTKNCDDKTTWTKENLRTAESP